MTVGTAAVTRIHLEGGGYVRASESLGQIADQMDDHERMGGWISVTDPGDERGKLVRTSRVLWLEEEPEDD